MLGVRGRRRSLNVQKAMWPIGELDLPHQHIDAGGAFAGLDAPAFLAMKLETSGRESGQGITR